MTAATSAATNPAATFPATQRTPKTSPRPPARSPAKTETVHTYGWYNRKYVADIEAKRATPMFLSMTIRDIWTPDSTGVNRIERETNFNSIMHKIADDNHLFFIDMATIEADRLEATGKDKAALLFPIDHTHTSSEGAELNAQSVVIALKIAKSPLVQYLNSAGQALHP